MLCAENENQIARGCSRTRFGKYDRDVQIMNVKSVLKKKNFFFYAPTSLASTSTVGE